MSDKESDCTAVYGHIVPDTQHHVGVVVNGIVYVKLEDARKLREGWDEADKRIAELEKELLRMEELEEELSIWRSVFPRLAPRLFAETSDE